jgi:hypothetical protein
MSAVTSSQNFQSENSYCVKAQPSKSKLEASIRSLPLAVLHFDFIRVNLRLGFLHSSYSSEPIDLPVFVTSILIEGPDYCAASAVRRN